MERDEVVPGLRVQIMHKTKYGADRWLAPAKVLSIVHPDYGSPNDSGNPIGRSTQT